MSHREQAQENFRKLQQEVEKSVFLKNAGELENENARTLLEIVYDFMEGLGWPDHEWSINTTLDGIFRPFYHGVRNGIGVVATAKILGKPLTISVEIAGPVTSGGPNTIVFNNRTIASLVLNNDRTVPSAEFFQTAKNALIAEAVNALSRP